MLGSVKVQKAKLLKALKDNKKKHDADYASGVASYREEAEKALRKRAIEVRDGKTMSTRFDLPEPRTYSAEYDRAIAMVEWSTEEVLDLDEGDFRAFVLDEWDWKNAFVGSTQVYNNRR